VELVPQAYDGIKSRDQAGAAPSTLAVNKNAFAAILVRRFDRAA
jgi:hypothetical protein